ncbi:MAG: hypothetical protein ACYSTG_03025 [Planctomycetota bacterium]
MIKFRCSNCNKKISTPDNYAGKRGKCPQCGQVVHVPPAQEEPVQDNQAVIKFRCPSCNQKIGVAKNYAGKRVRCAKCRQPIRVPEPQAEPVQKESVADSVEADEMFDGNVAAGDIFGDKSLTDELLAAEANAPPIEEPLQLKRIAPEPASSQAQTFETGTYLAGRSNGAKDSAAVRVAKSVGKIPLALAASFGFTLVGAMIWAWFSSLFGAGWFDFVDIMVIPVAALAGFGLIMVIKNQSVGIGLLAALIGLFGAISGKAFIAKWVILPEMKKMFTATLSEKPIFRDTLLGDFDIKGSHVFRKPSEQLLVSLIENEKSMFLMGCMQLAEDGEFEEDLAWQVAAAHVSGKVPLENAEEIKVAHEKVDALLKRCSLSQKEKIARAHYSKIAERMRKFVMETKVGFVFAFIATFSLLDLLWFPLALWGAYKIGAGRD